ncbi:MAG TPA: BolA family protein [Nitrospiria bacterium]|nr:BolA family protein [Nitrospiria bacterium]
MITDEAIQSYLQAALPDANVSIMDRTGTRDHFVIRVVSAAFQDKNLLDRNRMIYQALREPMADGRIHAMELKAQTPEEADAPRA